VARIDTEKASELSNRFDIHAIPTYILIKKTGTEIVKVDLVVSAHP
jgi:thioredoxin-related protein